jgi:hypothetical protein
MQIGILVDVLMKVVDQDLPVRKTNNNIFLLLRNAIRNRSNFRILKQPRIIMLLSIQRALVVMFLAVEDSKRAAIDSGKEFLIDSLRPAVSSTHAKKLDWDCLTSQIHNDHLLAPLALIDYQAFGRLGLEHRVNFNNICDN